MLGLMFFSDQTFPVSSSSASLFHQCPHLIHYAQPPWGSSVHYWILQWESSYREGGGWSAALAGQQCVVGQSVPRDSQLAGLATEDDNAGDSHEDWEILLAINAHTKQLFSAIYHEACLLQIQSESGILTCKPILLKLNFWIWGVLLAKAPYRKEISCPYWNNNKSCLQYHFKKKFWLI